MPQILICMQCKCIGLDGFAKTLCERLTLSIEGEE